MHVAPLQDTYITHVNMKHVYTYMPELQYSNTIFPITLSIHYGQILYKITLLPFRYVISPGLL